MPISAIYDTYMNSSDMHTTAPWTNASIATAARMVEDDDVAIMEFYAMFGQVTNKSTGTGNSFRQPVVLKNLIRIPDAVVQDVLQRPASAQTITLLCRRFKELDEVSQQAMLRIRTGTVPELLAASKTVASQPRNVMERYMYSKDPNIRIAFASNMHIQRNLRLEALLGRNRDGVCEIEGEVHSIEPAAKFLSSLTTAERLIIAKSGYTEILDYVMHVSNDMLLVKDMAVTVAEMLDQIVVTQNKGDTSKAEYQIRQIRKLLAQLDSRLFYAMKEDEVSSKSGPEVRMRNAIWGTSVWKQYSTTGLANEGSSWITKSLPVREVTRIKKRTELWKYKASRLRAAAKDLPNVKQDATWLVTCTEHELNKFIEATANFNKTEKALLLQRLDTKAVPASRKAAPLWHSTLLEFADDEFMQQLLQIGKKRNIFLFHSALTQRLNVEEAAKFFPIDLLIAWSEKEIRLWLSQQNIDFLDIVELSQTIDGTAEELVVLLS